MPFDSRPETETTIDPRVAVIDRMLALFGPRGGGWTQGTTIKRDRGRDRFCITGALHELCGEPPNYISFRDVAQLIHAFLPAPYHRISEYNDSHSFAEIKALLLRVRKWALTMG